MDGKKIVKILLDFENALSIEDDLINLVSNNQKEFIYSSFLTRTFFF